MRQKAQGNIAAIRLLKILEAENREATDDEKAVLVRYAGWGALAQVFEADWRVKRQPKLRMMIFIHCPFASAPQVYRPIVSRQGLRKLASCEPLTGLLWRDVVGPAEVKEKTEGSHCAARLPVF